MGTDPNADVAGLELAEERDREEGFAFSSGEGDYRSGPTWRGLLIAVIASAVLSIGATLLLGGTFGFSRQGTAGGCAPGDCRPPAVSTPGGR